MIEELPLPGFPKRRQNGHRSFSLWRVKPVEEWSAPQFYGYFVFRLGEKGRKPASTQKALLATFRRLIETFEGNFGTRGKEALKDFVDQCLLDPRCVGVGYLTRQAEPFLHGQGWKYREKGGEEEW